MTTFYSKIAEPIVDELPPYAGWLYVVLVRHIPRKLNKLPITLPDLAKAAQMSVRSVIRYTRLLEEKGLVAVQRQQKQGQPVAEVNVYSLTGQYASVALGGSDSQALGAVTQSHGLDSSIRNTPSGDADGNSSKTSEEEIPSILKTFFHDRAEAWIRELCQQCGFEYAVQVVGHTQRKRGLTNPIGYAIKEIREQSLNFKRSSWQEIARSEGADQAKEADDPKPDEAPEFDPYLDTTAGDASMDGVDESTQDDSDPTPPVDVPIPHEAAEAWNNAYFQLEIQLDRASFDTFLRGAWLVSADGWNLTIGVSNTYAAQILEHRMKRDICRVVSSVANQPTVEIEFVVKQRKQVYKPLFKVVA